MISKEGEIFLIPEDFKIERGANQSPTITLFSGKPADKALIPIGDAESFITKHITQHIQTLLKPMDELEAAAYQAHIALEREASLLTRQLTRLAEKINQTREDIKICSSDKWYDLLFPSIAAVLREGKLSNHKAKLGKLLAEEEALKPKLQSIEDDLKKAHFAQRGIRLNIPLHLHAFALKQLPKWITSALQACYSYKNNFHYLVKEGKIVPVDYNNTGVLQHKTSWSNGLQQFLQIKEGLKVTPESISTNFIAHGSFFKRYGVGLLGLTGTLGSPATQAFLAETYGVDLIVIPPYKTQLIAGNTPYRCKGLSPLVVAAEEVEDWYQAICKTTISKVRNDQPVLIICKYIEQVHYLKTLLTEKLGPDHAAKVFPYTGEGKDAEKFTKNSIDVGEIIIATNIAGRGTDIKTSPAAEAAGGLHVCLTFLPESYRVELQNVGRTARQGKKGSAQLVLHATQPYDQLRQARDDQETQATTRAKKGVAGLLVEDQLFNRFCALENELLPRNSELAKQAQYEAMQARWQQIEAELLTDEAIAEAFQEIIPDVTINDETSKNDLILALYKLTCKLNLLESSFPELEAFKKAYKDQMRTIFCTDNLCTQLQAEQFTADLIACFKQNKPFIPQGGHSLAGQYQWGAYERQALQERWGFWFSHAIKEKNNLDPTEPLAAFEDFAEKIKQDGQADQLVQNPYYYVKKGNQILEDKKEPHLALPVYERAIALDPDYSLNARYNKARALLTQKNNRGSSQKEAKAALEEASRLINYQYKPDLVGFITTLGLEEKPESVGVSDHVRHHLDILSQQNSYVEEAIKVIDEALEKNWHVKIKLKPLKEALKKADGDHSQAIEEAATNGLEELFTLELKDPYIVLKLATVALVSLAQIATGIIVGIYTGGLVGVNFIMSGVQDMITVITSSIKGSFNMGKWALQKGVSWAIQVATMGFAKLKQGVSDIKDSFNQFKDTICGVTHADTAVATFAESAEAINVVKHNLQVAKQTFITSTQTGITQQLLGVVSTYAVGGPLLNHIKSFFIDGHVHRKIAKTL